MPTKTACTQKEAIKSVKLDKGCQVGILEFLAIQSNTKAKTKTKQNTFIEHSLDTGIGSEVFPGRRNYKSWT